MTNTTKLHSDVQAAILAQRRPLVVQLDVELPDGQIERVSIGTGRYRAKEAATTVVALGGVSMRLLGKDGTVLRAMRLREPEQATLPIALAPTVETDMDRAMRIVGAIYDQAHRQAAEAAAQTAAATATEREVATAGMTRAIEVMAAAVDRAAQQLVELHERERETSAREVEVTAAAAGAEAAAAGGPAAAAATIMRELPAAMPALMQFVQLAQGAVK